MRETDLELTYPKVRFQCTRCVLCCGDNGDRIRHILILTREALTISEAIMKPVDVFAKQTRGHEPYSYEIRKTLEDGKCVFLKGDECQIYDLRPLVCRFYPFELIIGEDGKANFGYTLECPGLGTGKRLSKTYFENLVRQAEREFKREQMER